MLIAVNKLQISPFRVCECIYQWIIITRLVVVRGQTWTMWTCLDSPLHRMHSHCSSCLKATKWSAHCAAHLFIQLVTLLLPNTSQAMWIVGRERICFCNPYCSHLIIFVYWIVSQFWMQFFKRNLRPKVIWDKFDWIDPYSKWPTVLFSLIEIPLEIFLLFTLWGRDCQVL